LLTFSIKELCKCYYYVTNKNIKYYVERVNRENDQNYHLNMLFLLTLCCDKRAAQKPCYNKIMSPMKPGRPCKVPTCINLIKGSGSYCNEHQHLQPSVKRPSPSKRGYGARWCAIREEFLKINPVCCIPGCGRPATEVDHILALRDGGTHDFINLRSMCKSHHSRHTATHGGGYGNRKG